MKVVQGDEIPLQRGLEYRGGMFHSRRVLEGQPGAVDNFQLSIGVTQGDFYSPRHHHNFEQIRIGLEGTLDYDRDGKMSAGVVGYFPEGVYYGPQSQNPDEVATAAVLQFGGASGSGYLSNAEVRAGMEELRQHGEFKNGVYRRQVPFHGKKNVDGYQAIWEHMHQRPMIYPSPRYDKPIFMDARHYEWVAVAPGVFEKLLGVFTERRSEAGFLRLDAGANHTVRGHGIYLVLSGVGEIAGQPMRKLTTLYLAREETATITARETAELMHFGLPNLAGVRMPERDALPAEAAE